MTAHPSVLAAGPLTLAEAEGVLSSLPPPPARPSAPTPDYASELPAEPDRDTLPPPGADDDHPRCPTCERPLARRVEPSGGQDWTCVVCDDPGAVERCSCEEALALRTELVLLRAKAAQLEARARAADEEVLELRAQVADLEQVLEAEARVRNRLLNERDRLRAELARREVPRGSCLTELARREAKRDG